MIRRARCWYSDGVDPYRNLAMEDALLRSLPPEEAALFLWRNDRTVVIGRGQNAWSECDVPLLRAEGVKLARRPTGGGAVYHDRGNLNFSICVPEEDYSLPRQFDVLLRALADIGVAARTTGRNDIALTDGAKISGNAFRHTVGRALHHGTILVCADMDTGLRYLKVDPEKWKAKGVSSVRARVKNLCDLLPGIAVAEVARAFLRAFAAEYGEDAGAVSALTVDDLPGASDTAEKYASWDWIYGMSPAGATSLRTRFPWGGLEISATVRDGRVNVVRVYTDALDETLATRLEAALQGCLWRGEELADCAERLSIPDAAAWLRSAL